MKKRNWINIIWIIALLTSTSAYVRAEEAAGDGDAAAGSVEADRRSAYMEKRRELMQLKESDPEAFRKKVVELRNSAQKRLDGLQTSDPETYQRIMSRRERRIEPRYEHLREENPEAFAKMQEHRQGLREKRVEWYRKNDPAEFEGIQNRRKLRQAAWNQQGQGQSDATPSERSWKPQPDRLAFDQNRYDRADIKVHRQEWRENALGEGRPGHPDDLRKKRQQRPQRPLGRENGR